MQTSRSLTGTRRLHRQTTSPNDMQRTTRSRSGVLQPSNINKPFKSPIIKDTPKESAANAAKPKKPAKDFLSLLEDDIIDSDDEDVVASDSSRTPEASESRAASAPSSKPSKQDEIEDDEPEERQTAANPFAARQGFGNSKRGKFAKRTDREMTQNMERRKTERLETAGDKRGAPAADEFQLKPFTNYKSLMDKVHDVVSQREKADEVLAAMSSPQKEKDKDQLGIARFSHIMKKNNLHLDPKLLELLSDNLDESDGSDSDNSTSSGKRKRGNSSSPENPIDLDDDAPAKPKKSKKAKRKGEYLCPMCDEEVSKALYESYMPDLPNKLALKRKLHMSHKLEKAHAKKKQLDIPDIDWDEVESRCTKYLPYLEDIIARKTPSHYRDVSERFFKKKRTNGKSKTELIFDSGNWEKEYPGYYGSRGRDIMADVIGDSRTIRAALKRLKLSRDVTITSCGEGGYIQSILIPELATRLVMEDFKMADDKVAEGRKMMINTIDIGLSLNDDAPQAEHKDGMDWWWKEQEEKRLAEEETEPENSQASIYVDVE
ncbi:hypothetical protein Dda_0756 [Drechslerella dactyloides]|uniref:Restriction of telomere capping protein 4 n=1 Tax=Drechslerella dactyloides TaxID=74499 RepID=A0AAD6NNA2_DREDA|nr:hypothetical protein Dda_0756 [Drechslerella dactyloides]